MPRKGAHYKGMRRCWLDLFRLCGDALPCVGRIHYLTADPPPVDIPAAACRLDTEIVGAGDQVHRMAEGGPILPTAGVGNVDRAQDRCAAIEIQAKAAAVVGAGDAIFHGIGAGCWNMDAAVGHPIASIYPAHILPAIGVGGVFQLDAELG